MTWKQWLKRYGLQRNHQIYPPVENFRRRIVVRIAPSDPGYRELWLLEDYDCLTRVDTDLVLMEREVPGSAREFAVCQRCGWLRYRIPGYRAPDGTVDDGETVQIWIGDRPPGDCLDARVDDLAAVGIEVGIIETCGCDQLREESGGDTAVS